MSSFPPRIFLLSPARLDGKRAHLLFHPVTMFPVARALHSTAGAPIGEIFTFLSGLYFRGKLAYAEAFARPPQGLNSGVFVITPNGGLLAPSVRVTLDDLARLAKTDIDPSAKEFREPLQKEAKALAQALGPRGERARGYPAGGPATEAASSVDPILNQHSCEFGCGQSPSACRMGLGRHRLQAVGLALSLRLDPRIG